MLFRGTQPRAPPPRCAKKHCASGTPAAALPSHSVTGSSFHAHHLTQGVDDFDQVLLGLHHCIDGLIGHGSLVDYVLILAALHALSGGDVVGHGEAALGLSAGHGSARAVAATGKALQVPLAAHNVGARTHAAWDYSHVAFAGPHCSLARDQDVFTIVVLPGHVVVVAVDCL